MRTRSTLTGLLVGIFMVIGTINSTPARADAVTSNSRGGPQTVTMHDVADTSVAFGHFGLPHLPVLIVADPFVESVASFAFRAPTGVAENSPYISATMHLFSYAWGKVCIYRAAISAPIIESPHQLLPPRSYLITCPWLHPGENNVNISRDVAGEVHDDGNTATYILAAGPTLLAARENGDNAPTITIAVGGAVAGASSVLVRHNGTKMMAKAVG